jgi:hypothetical protein
VLSVKVTRKRMNKAVLLEFMGISFQSVRGSCLYENSL